MSNQKRLLIIIRLPTPYRYHARTVWPLIKICRRSDIRGQSFKPPYTILFRASEKLLVVTNFSRDNSTPSPFFVSNYTSSALLNLTNTNLELFKTKPFCHQVPGKSDQTTTFKRLRLKVFSIRKMYSTMKRYVTTLQQKK